MRAQVKTLDAGSAGEIELSDAIFGLEPRKDLIHRMVRWQLLKRMAGTHHVQDRSEVTTTGKKMYRQKGTGGARHGSRRAAQFVGGAKAHGPVVRSHAFDLPKKLRALALRHALSSKAKTGALIVLDSAQVAEPKTAALRASFEWTGYFNDACTATAICQRRVSKKSAFGSGGGVCWMTPIISWLAKSSRYMKRYCLSSKYW